MNDPSQRIQTPRKGDSISAALIRQIMDKIVRSIVPGRGILIRRAGDQVIIEARETATRGAGGSAAGWTIASEPNSLPSAAATNQTTLGRVNTGDHAGKIYAINGDLDAWEIINGRYVAASKAALPGTQTQVGSWGYVNAGADEGMICFYDGNNWVAINVCE